MKALLLSACLCAAGLSWGQTTLRYQWKPNATYRYKADMTDEVTMGGSAGGNEMGGMPGMSGMPGMNLGGMMGMAGSMKFKTTATFAIKINKVEAGGGAAGIFYLESFRVTDGTGKALATLANIPKGTLKAPFTVDELGNFDFSQIPVLVCDQEKGGYFLTCAQVKPGETATAEAVVDGERVKVYAEFAKGGALKAGYSVATIGSPKAKTVEVKEENEVIDLIPTDLLEMFVLPEEAVSPGQPMKLAAAGNEQTFQVQKMEGSTATLRTTIGHASSAAGFKKQGDEMSEAAGMGAADTEGDDEIPTIAQEVTADITTRFDNAAGIFQGMSGTSSFRSNMVGMEVTEKSSFTMTKL